MLLNICLKKIDMIQESSLSIKRLEAEMHWQKVAYLEEKDSLNDLSMKINKNYIRDLKCKLSSCIVEIQAIEDELLYQACIRIQMFFRKSIKFHFRVGLLSLDTIRQYKRYLTSLKEDLIDTRLNILFSSNELTDFKNDYLLLHVKYLKEPLTTRNDLIIDYQVKLQALSTKVEHLHLDISKTEMDCKMGHSDIMKIQSSIKGLRGYPNYMKLLDDFIINANY